MNRKLDSFGIGIIGLAFLLGVCWTMMVLDNGALKENILLLGALEVILLILVFGVFLNNNRKLLKKREELK